MVEVIGGSYPKANKDHICQWCGCTINKDSVYQRTTNKFDGIIYDWVNHVECRDVADMLDMFNSDYDGLSEDRFCELVYDYLDEFHTDFETDDLKEEISKLNMFEKVKFIITDFKK